MTSKQKYILSALSILSMALLFLGVMLTDKGWIGPDALLWWEGVALSIGLFTLAGYLEKIFGERLYEFRISALGWAAFLGIIGYFARMYALDDVNKLFGIDPGALPMTLIAAISMRLFIWTKWPFILVAVIAIFNLTLMWKDRYFPAKTPEPERLAVGTLTISNLIFCLLGLLFIQYQLDDDGRHQKLYRTAHASDFSSSFNCAGIDNTRFSVLFIGPEQRRALVAPKLPLPKLFAPRSAEYLQTLKVPQKFPVLECQSAIQFESWAENL